MNEKSGILVAGIGNIFKGDDAFGCEVVKRLAGRDLGADVTVIDFGIRGIDLTYALLGGYRSAILIDTISRGGNPGDLHLIEPEPLLDDPEPGDLMMSGHDLDPAKVLRLVRAMGGACERILLVACEPLTFGDEHDGAMGLSEPVAAAIERAVTMVGEAIETLKQSELVA
jgi:hydrogenase maturation protease